MGNVPREAGGVQYFRYAVSPRDDEVAVLAFAANGKPRADILGPSYLILESMRLIACGPDRCWDLRDGIAAGTYVSMRCNWPLVLTGEQWFWEELVFASMKGDHHSLTIDFPTFSH